jgi:hypothetical protein
VTRKLSVTGFFSAADASTPNVCSICVTNSDDSIKVKVLTGQ